MQKSESGHKLYKRTNLGSLNTDKSEHRPLYCVDWCNSSSRRHMRNRSDYVKCKVDQMDGRGSNSSKSYQWHRQVI